MIAVPVAALLASIMLFGFAVLHGALALGAPLASYAWGGQAEAGPLPRRLQTGSTVRAPFIAAMSIVLLIRGGWLYPEIAGEMSYPSMAVFLFVVMQMFGALRSQSRPEKRIMGPLYAVAAALTGSVAFGWLSNLPAG